MRQILFKSYAGPVISRLASLLCLMAIAAAMGNQAARADASGTAGAPTKPRPFAVMIGLTNSVNLDRRFLPPSFEYDAYSLHPYVLGLTADIGARRISDSNQRISSLYLDVKIGPKKAGRGSGVFSQAADQDFESTDLFRIGFGVQRRFVATSSRNLHPYVGVGAGLYYARLGSRRYGTDQEGSPAIGFFSYSNSFAADHVAVGGKLMLGVDARDGLFAQVSVDSVPGGHTKYGMSWPDQNDTSLSVGYRF